MDIAIETLADNHKHFTDLMDQHQGIVVKVARTYCWHRDDRDDLIQEITLQLWRAFPTYDDSRSFSTWMYRVALNVSISWVRRNSYRQHYSVDISGDIDHVADTNRDSSNDDRLAFLQSFVDRLDPLDRALMLLYLEERSYRDIAEILGISETNVATKISRLKKRVREQSATHYEGDQHGTR